MEYVALRRVAGYAWAEAVWRVLVETMEDTQRKLADGLLSEVQLNGFCLLSQGWLSVDERLRRAREEYTLERTVHEKTKIEMQRLEEQLMELKSRLRTYEKEEAEDEEEDAVHEFTPEVCSEERRRRASDIMTRMKFKPRLQKASAARASPYTNPLHRRKGPKRARRCLTMGKKAIGVTMEKVGMIPTVGDIVQNDATTDRRDECGIQMGGDNILCGGAGGL